MGFRPGLVMVRGLFAPPRARVLRSGAPPEPSVAVRDQGNPGRGQGGWSLRAGRPGASSPASS